MSKCREAVIFSVLQEGVDLELASGFRYIESVHVAYFKQRYIFHGFFWFTVDSAQLHAHRIFALQVKVKAARVIRENEAISPK